MSCGLGNRCFEEKRVQIDIAIYLKLSAKLSNHWSWFIKLTTEDHF